MIRLSSLGDIVLSTSVVAPLRDAGFEVYYVSKKPFSPLLENIPGVAGVFAFDKKLGGEKAAREEFFAWCKQNNFSLCLDLQDSWRTWMWRRALRELFPVHIARKERFREWLIFLARAGRFLGFGRGGRARKFRAVAEAAVGLKANRPLTELFVTEAEKESVKPLIPAGDYAVLLPASAWKGKEWPYFKQLAARLSQRVPVVVLGAEKDLGCDEVGAAAAAVNPSSRNLRGQTSLRGSLAIVAQARWVIGNDTGLVHAGEALGLDVAMVEGPTHEYMGFSPYRPGSVLLGLPLLCRPCSKAGKVCPRFGSYKCLNDLSEASVARTLRQRGYPC